MVHCVNSRPWYDHGLVCILLHSHNPATSNSFIMSLVHVLEVHHSKGPGGWELGESKAG